MKNHDVRPSESPLMGFYPETHYKGRYLIFEVKLIGNQFYKVTVTYVNSRYQKNKLRLRYSVPVSAGPRGADLYYYSTYVVGQNECDERRKTDLVHGVANMKALLLYIMDHQCVPFHGHIPAPEKLHRELLNLTNDQVIQLMSNGFNVLRDTYGNIGSRES